MKKRIVVLFVTITSISLLSGCGGKEGMKDIQAETNIQAEANTQTEGNVQPEVHIQAGELMTPAEYFAGGDGTKENPYQISNAAEWYRFAYVMDASNITIEDEEYAQSFDDKYYILTDDIVVNDVSDYENWAENPPKYDWNPIDSFEGYLDGQGHTITGFYCSDLQDEGVTSAGVFDSIYVGGVIENLNMEKAMVVTTAPASDAGVIAARVSEGGIRNCKVSGKVIGNGMDLGGIAGTAVWSMIENCTFTGEVEYTGTETGNFGGIIGSASGCVVTNCTNEGTLTSEAYASLGGIAGGFSATAMGFSLDEETYPDEAAEVEKIISTVKGAGIGIKNCTNKGTVTTAEGDAGGIVGEISDGLGHEYRDLVVIEECINKGDITSNDTNCFTGNAGGICGFYGTEPAMFEETRVKGSLSFKNCINKGNVLCAGGSVAGVLATASMKYGTLSFDGCANLGTLAIEETEVAGMGGIAGQIGIFEGVDLRFENMTDETVYNVKKNCIAGGMVASVTVAESNTEELSITLKNCQGLGTFNIEDEESILSGSYGALCGHFLEGVHKDDFQGTLDIVSCKVPEGVPAVASSGSLFEKVEALIEVMNEAEE